MTLDCVFLSVFLLFVSVGMGAGLYEARVVYPNWARVIARDAGREADFLRPGGSGAAILAVYSPAALLLAVVNGYLAWQQVGIVRQVWLAASLIIIIKSVVTYVYFVPTMMRRFEHAAGIEPIILRRMVSVWTALSPLRAVAEFIAWTAGICALILVARS